MAQKTIYFSDEEVEFINSQPPGYIRSLIKAEMTVSPDRMPVRSELHQSVSDKNYENDNTCKHCGAFLPYYGAKVCKACRKKQ